MRGALVFISDQLIYLELHKTGCTYVRKRLGQLVEGELVGKHNQITRALLESGRTIVGSVRDPWDWYLSLWTYGCDGRGSVRTRLCEGSTFRLGDQGWRSHPSLALRSFLLGSPLSRRYWQRLYRDPSDAGAFREWLFAVHDPAVINAIGEAYAGYTLCQCAGLLTQRFMRLFCCPAGEMARLSDLSNTESVREFIESSCFVEEFLRNESLEEDLLSLCRRHNIATAEDLSRATDVLGRTNASSRRGGAVDFFNQETAALIMERDGVIVSRFGYVPPVWE